MPPTKTEEEAKADVKSNGATAEPKSNGMPPLDSGTDLRTAFFLLAKFKRELAKAFPSESESHAKWRQYVVESLALSKGK